MSDLSEWSKAIQQMGEESRQKLDEALDKWEKEYPNWKSSLGDISNGDLLEYYLKFNARPVYKRESDLYKKCQEAVEVEILKRMAS